MERDTGRGEMRRGVQGGGGQEVEGWGSVLQAEEGGAVGKDACTDARNMNNVSRASVASGAQGMEKKRKMAGERLGGAPGGG